MINLGIIGPEDIILSSRKISQSYFEEIKLIELPYTESEFETNYEEAYGLVNKNAAEVGGFLFTGPLPYYKVLDKDITDKYLFYYPIYGSAIYKTLLKMKQHCDINIAKVSIDTLPLDKIEKIYNDLEIGINHLVINDRDIKDFSFQSFVDFHLDVYNKGKTEAGITAVKSVYDALKDSGIPVFRITPTFYTIKRTFEFIRSILEKQKSMGNEIVVQKIKIADEVSFANNFRKLEREQKKMALYQTLLQYSRRFFGTIFHVGNEYVILMNKDEFKSYTNNYDNYPLIKEIKDKLSIKVNAGIGIARGVSEAEERAERALKKISNDTHNAYLFGLKSQKMGPLKSSSDEMLINSDIKRNELENFAEKSKLSIDKIIKIYDLGKKKNKITAKELAEYLSVSHRTGNRIINKLLDISLAEEIGYKKTNNKGRPSKFYKLNLVK